MSRRQQWARRRNMAVGRVAGIRGNLRSLLAEDSQAANTILTPNERRYAEEILTQLHTLSKVTTHMTFDDFHALVAAQKERRNGSIS